MNKKIGYGIVGYGIIAKTHLEGMMANRALHPGEPGGWPRALCTRRPEQCADLPFDAVYSDYGQMLEDEQVHVVDICTPNHLHAEAAIAAMQAGKAVYVEKPLSGKLREAEQMRDMARQCGLPNQTALVLRFRPDVNRAKDMLRAGAIGELIHFRTCFYHGSYMDPNRPISWRQTADEAGGGAMMDLGVHILDLMLYLLEDKVADVRAAARRTVYKQRPASQGSSEMVDNHTDEYSCALLTMQSGIPGIVESSRVSSSAICNDSIEIFGTKGSLLLELDGGGLTLLPAGGGAIKQPSGDGEYESSLRPFLPGPRHSMGPFTDAHAAAVKNIGHLAAGLPGFIGAPDFAAGCEAQRLVHIILEAAK